MCGKTALRTDPIQRGLWIAKVLQCEFVKAFRDFRWQIRPGTPARDTLKIAFLKPNLFLATGATIRGVNGKCEAVRNFIAEGRIVESHGGVDAINLHFTLFISVGAN
jgi:hypothetical protein